jgi:hypothetical protein
MEGGGDVPPFKVSLSDEVKPKCANRRDSTKDRCASRSTDRNVSFVADVFEAADGGHVLFRKVRHCEEGWVSRIIGGWNGREGVLVGDGGVFWREDEGYGAG